MASKPMFFANVIIASPQTPARVAGLEGAIPGQTQHDYEEEPHEKREFHERST